jgi:alpha-D-ribose 1-methylphosphonate 5-triphosphate synthase subunit PhnH
MNVPTDGQSLRLRVSGPVAPAASRQLFRVVLSALSKPGELQRIPPSAIDSSMPMTVRLLLGLAHSNIGIAVVGEQEWQSEICAVTGAHAAAVDEARMVATLDGLSGATARALSRGSTLEPESAAQVFVGCRWLTDRPKSAMDGVALRLMGPGIPGAAQLWVGGLDVDALVARNESRRDFPTGFDMWLIDPSGRVCGLPRSTAVTILSEGSAK